MPFDGIAMYAVISELQTTFYGSRIMKIYQPKKDELWIITYKNGQELKLLISVNPFNCRIHISEGEIHNPASPPMFCMLLRKHLVGGKVKEINQKELERIVEIKIQNDNEYMEPMEYSLIIEIMGKHSNIILLNDKGIIIDAIKRISFEKNRYREILPGETYIDPPMGNKVNLLSFDREFTLKALNNSMASKEQKNICHWLIDSFMGISSVAAQELAFRAELDPIKGIEYFSEDEVKRLLYHLEKMSHDLLNKNFSPDIYKDFKNNNWEDFWVFPLKYRGSSLIKNNNEKNDINRVVDLFYRKKEELQELNAQKKILTSELRKQLKKLKQALKHISQKLNETRDLEKYRLWGELLSAYMYMVKPGMKQITLPNYAQGGETDIPLNEKYSPSRNAQNYFHRYKKLYATRRIFEKRKQDIINEIEYIENELVNIENCESLDDLKEIYREVNKQGYIKGHIKSVPMQKKSEPLKFRSSDGFVIYVGKNNRQNDLLTLKKARPDDMWFHAKNIPGSHVIVENKSGKVSDKSITEACILAAYFSKARNGSNVPVDYTLKKFVKKPAGAKPGFVIYDHHKTMFVTPDKKIIDKLIF